MVEKVILGAVVIAISGFLLRGYLPGAGSKHSSTLNHPSPGVKLETATFGGGCFWHVEEDLRGVEGVVSTVVGYEGGTKPEPTYADVCSDKTGHVEVVQLQYDPSKITYEQLLQAFFKMHDPTSMDRQGFDFGTQYRSVIFYHTPEQQATAESFKEKAGKNGDYKNPIVTKILPASTFWKAEEYHQQYYEKKGL